MIEFPDILHVSADRIDMPLPIHWPESGNPSAIQVFDRLCDRQAFVAGKRLHFAIPHVVAAKYWRAQKLYFLGWIDYDLIKAGELAALTALELALRTDTDGPICSTGRRTAPACYPR